MYEFIYLTPYLVVCVGRTTRQSTDLAQARKVKFSYNCVRAAVRVAKRQWIWSLSLRVYICVGIFLTGNNVLQYVRFYVELIAEVKCDPAIMGNTLLSLLSLPLLFFIEIDCSQFSFPLRRIGLVLPFYGQRRTELCHSPTAKVKWIQTVWVI